jgi:hypothetical protein
MFTATANLVIERREAVLLKALRPRRDTLSVQPTSSSWMNLVERFFADLTADVIRTGSFGSVKELVDDINAYLAERNANPRPYKWKAKGEAILEKNPSRPSRPQLVTICESGHLDCLSPANGERKITATFGLDRDAGIHG